MSSKQEKETVWIEEQRTREYRQLASYLASIATAATRDGFKQELQAMKKSSFSSSSSISSLHALPSVRVAQHLLTNHHPGWISLELLNRSDDNNNNISGAKETPARKSKQIVLPCCPHCGGPLQPGFQNTTVRLQPASSATRSRSQRRRLSRRIARIHQAKKKQGKQSNTTPQLSRLGYFVKEHFGDESSSSSSAAASADTNTKYNDSLTLNYKLEWIQCRNVLQIRCGACEGHSQLPGFSRPRLTKKPKEAPTIKTGINIAASAAQADVDPTEDFITLSNNVATKEKITRKKKHKQVTMISSVGSNKKRKTDSKNKNKLMHFLSSLNDH